MATSIHSRKVHVYGRAATDLKNAAMVGTNSPYLEISLGDSETVTTHVDKNAPQNPVWDQDFEVDIGGASPGEEPMVLRVTAKNQTSSSIVPKQVTQFVSDTIIGTGSVPLTQLFGMGSEEARVPLHDSTGDPAGIAFIGVKMATPEDEKEIRKLNYIFLLCFFSLGYVSLLFS